MILTDARAKKSRAMKESLYDVLCNTTNIKMTGETCNTFCKNA